MADSKRLATLKALTTYLSTEVAVANGYLHNLTGNVYRGRALFGDTTPLPCVSILDNLNPDRFPVRAGADSGEAGVSGQRWILLLQGWVDDDKVNPTDPAEQLLADVKKALAKLDHLPHPLSNEAPSPNYQLGGLIAGLEYEPGTVRPPDQNSAKAYFWMRVILKFTENVRDPFDLT